jgi:hypothetical protein
MTDFFDFHPTDHVELGPHQPSLSDQVTDDGFPVAPHLQDDPWIEELDINRDGRIDVVTADTDHDGRIDEVRLDLNHDNRPELRQLDTDNDGALDLLLRDSDGDGTPDQVDRIHDTGHSMPHWGTHAWYGSV